MKEENLKIKQMAEEEIKKNKKDHNELTMLREMKKNLQKELNRAIQENLNAKYNLESIKENKKMVESNLNSLKETYIKEDNLYRNFLTNLDFSFECIHSSNATIITNNLFLFFY